MKGKIVAVTLLALVSGVQSLGQTYYGGLRGTVTDQTGQAIVGGTVKLKSETTNLERSVITNGYGEYVISSVDPASYTVTVTASGFKALVRTGVVISTQQVLTLDFGVQLGQNNEVVQVVEDVPLVESSNIGTNSCKSGTPEGRLDSYISGGAFSTAPAYSYGNASRTVGCLSPGLANWDLSIFKSFPIAERISFQVRAEALNAFNTPQFRAPNMAFGSANFGKITQQANFPRYLQLGGRLPF